MADSPLPTAAEARQLADDIQGVLEQLEAEASVTARGRVRRHLSDVLFDSSREIESWLRALASLLERREDAPSDASDLGRGQLSAPNPSQGPGNREAGPASLQSIVEDARDKALEEAAQECDRHAAFCKNEAHRGGTWEHLMTRRLEAAYNAERIRALKGQRSAPPAAPTAYTITINFDDLDEACRTYARIEKLLHEKGEIGFLSASWAAPPAALERETVRKLVVETAQAWYNAAKFPTPDCDVATGLVNALNHTEGALIAVLDGNAELTDRLRRRLKSLRAPPASSGAEGKKEKEHE